MRGLTHGKRRRRGGRVFLCAVLGIGVFTALRLLTGAGSGGAPRADAETVLRTARAELGYLEKADAERLDSPRANAGDGNYTKYARDLFAAGYYNGDKNGWPWCDVFVDWCFYVNFGKAGGERLECQSGELGAGCAYSAEYYALRGRFDGEPRPGDQIFFSEDGEICHTGLVERVTADSVTVIEGNAAPEGTEAEGVCRKSYARDDERIAGYGHPLYTGGNEG